MKKIFISLATAALLFTACSSDENQNTDQTTAGAGSLAFNIELEDAGKKAAATDGMIPITSWDNIKEVQIFLYKKGVGAVDGDIAYSYRLTGAEIAAKADKKFSWNDIPVGTYDLAVVANLNVSATEKMAMSLDGGVTKTDFTRFNVVGKKVNSQVMMDLNPSAFPANHTFEAGDKPYSPPTEIFTAYAQDVTITEGVVNTLGGTLGLKREVAMMRVRIHKKHPALSTVDFAEADNFIVIHRMPVGFGLKTQTPAFGGGIFNTASDDNRIMVAATGANTFLSANPASGYKNTNGGAVQILDANFTLWRDIMVLPNQTRAENKLPSANADNARKYFIVLSAKAPANYTLSDGVTKTTAPTNIYWSGLIEGVFTPNIIREVNLTITSPGGPDNPDGPGTEGGLEITLGTPEDWNSVVESTHKEI
ncbi:MAG: FimB/Mfa2 family fimbrial subunit [Dysgonomonas sp.]|nr:FimB/Mfa2 family fimbrial subunit [Dysgonomonas sp.]